MAHSERHPGKFEACDDYDLGRKLHEMTMDGCDEDLGDVQDFGWYGLILMPGYTNDSRSYIVNEDGQGFFTYDEYETPVQAQAAWAVLNAEYNDFMLRDVADEPEAD